MHPRKRDLERGTQRVPRVIAVVTGKIGAPAIGRGEGKNRSRRISRATPGPAHVATIGHQSAVIKVEPGVVTLREDACRQQSQSRQQEQNRNSPRRPMNPSFRNLPNRRINGDSPFVNYQCNNMIIP